MGCCYTIPQSEMGITETFGKFDSIQRPGFQIINPFITTLRGTMSLRVQPLSCTIETKTKDNVFVNIGLIVQYKAQERKVYEAFYELTHASNQLLSYVHSNVRAQIPLYTLDQLFEAKDKIAADVKADLEAEFDNFGYMIMQTLITDVDPDKAVKKAMNEINAASRMREATKDRAEAERIAVVKAAEADAESKRLSGVGLAESRKAVVTGLHDSILAFSQNSDIGQSEVMELLLMNQYFDTLKDMAHNSKQTTMFVPHTPNTVGNLSSQLRAGLVEAKTSGYGKKHA